MKLEAVILDPNNVDTIILDPNILDAVNVEFTRMVDTVIAFPTIVEN